MTNADVLYRLNREKEILITTIKRRKLEYFGHVMRGARYSLLRLIMEGKIRRKRIIGRRRVSWFRN